MIFVLFLSGLLVSLALFKLGQYAAIIAMIANAGKMLVLFTVIATMVLVYRKLLAKTRTSKPKLLSP